MSFWVGGLRMNRGKVWIRTTMAWMTILLVKAAALPHLLAHSETKRKTLRTTQLSLSLLEYLIGNSFSCFGYAQHKKLYTSLVWFYLSVYGEISVELVSKVAEPTKREKDDRTRLCLPTLDAHSFKFRCIWFILIFLELHLNGFGPLACAWNLFWQRRFPSQGYCFKAVSVFNRQSGNFVGSQPKHFYGLFRDWQKMYIFTMLTSE